MLVRRLARPLLAAPFAILGFEALKSPGKRADMTAPVAEKISDLSGGTIPNNPGLLVRVNGAVMVASGLLLATGKAPRLGGLALAASLVPTTVVGHPFWESEDAAGRTQQRIHFLKNMGLVGAALLAAVDTDGKPGLAWRAANATKVAKREARIAKAQAKLAIA